MASFRPTERIRRRAEFQLAYERGTRIRGRYATIFVMANQLDVSRLGIAATRKLGGSVVRNRAKRLVREIFRRNKVSPGYDIILIPKRELLGAGLAALESNYRLHLERRLGESQ